VLEVAHPSWVRLFRVLLDGRSFDHLSSARRGHDVGIAFRSARSPPTTRPSTCACGRNMRGALVRCSPPTPPASRGHARRDARPRSARRQRAPARPRARSASSSSAMSSSASPRPIPRSATDSASTSDALSAHQLAGLGAFEAAIAVRALVTPTQLSARSSVHENRPTWPPRETSRWARFPPHTSAWLGL